MKIEEMIAIFIVLPILLCIVLGVAYIARRAKTVQGNIIKRNIALIKEMLGNDVEYVDKGKLPFHIVGEDPSLHAKYANSCKCRDMLKGNYKGVDYIVTNMITMHSEGYGEVSNSIFSGSYILFNVRKSQIKPLYACSNHFWQDFNVKESLHFNVHNKELYESNSIGNRSNFKLLLSNADWNRQEVSSQAFSMLQPFFQDNKHSVSLFVYTDGKIGIALRNYKLFNFYQGRLPELDDIASENTNVREIIQRDAKLIKHYLEKVHVMLKQN